MSHKPIVLTLLFCCCFAVGYGACAAGGADGGDAPTCDRAPESKTAPQAPCSKLWMGDPNELKLDELLDRIEKRCAALKDFQAEVIYKVEQPLIEAVAIRHGELYYQVRDQAVRFRIHFRDLQQAYLDDDEPALVSKFDEDFSFDGQWAVRRNSHSKTLQRWQLSAKPAGQESFRIGQGPFPTPFAIKKVDLLEQFRVAIAPADPCDPAGTIRLQLKPKPAGSFAEKYRSIELWFDRQTILPRQIRLESSSNDFTHITWSKIKTDRPISPAHFQLEPAGPDWIVETYPLKKSPVSNAQRNENVEVKE